MPRVYLSENERLCDRLASWVYGKLKTNGLSQTDLAREMQISQQALSMKLRIHSFSFTDFLTFVRVFKPDEQELDWLVGKGRR